MEHTYQLLLVIFKNVSKKTVHTIHFNDCCKLNISFENKPAAIRGIFDAFPLSGTMTSQNLHTPWLLWRHDSFYFIKRNNNKKKQQQSNNIDLRTEIVTEQRKFKCKRFFSKWQKKQWRKPITEYKILFTHAIRNT